MLSKKKKSLLNVPIFLSDFFFLVCMTVHASASRSARFTAASLQLSQGRCTVTARLRSQAQHKQHNRRCGRAQKTSHRDRKMKTRLGAGVTCLRVFCSVSAECDQVRRVENMLILSFILEGRQTLCLLIHANKMCNQEAL